MDHVDRSNMRLFERKQSGTSTNKYLDAYSTKKSKSKPKLKLPKNIDLPPQIIKINSGRSKVDPFKDQKK